MKTKSFLRPARRVLALSLALLLATPTAFAHAGERVLRAKTELVDGLTFQNDITVNAEKRVESFSFERAPDSAAYPILLQASGTMYGAASINKVVSHAQELGYRVLGAINTDYFSMKSGVPMGVVIENGVYKSSGEGRPAMLITDGKVSLVEKVGVDIFIKNDRSGVQSKLQSLNKLRAPTGGLYLFNRDFSTVSTHTTGEGWYVRMRLRTSNPDDPQGIWGTAQATQQLGVNSTLTLEVTQLYRGNEPTSIGEDEYILSADNQSGYGFVYDDFQIGDTVTLTTSCSNAALSSAQWAGGVGDVMAVNGKLTNTGSWLHINEGKAPRTALGVKSDGTLLAYAVDGRQAGYSAGLSQLDLAQEMLREGCEWVVNLDGGGSTAISALLPGDSTATVRNIPSEGSLRACATYLLLVTDGKSSGRVERLAVRQQDLVVLTGSSLTLKTVVGLDDQANVISEAVNDVYAYSQNGLGTVKNNVYTAGATAGVDTIVLSSEDTGATGTANINIVDKLTDLKVTRLGSATALKSLSVKSGEQVQLAVTGTYWGREALRAGSAATWTVSEGVGSVDENGLFTAAKTGLRSGEIKVSMGGLSYTLRVEPFGVHVDVDETHWGYAAVEYCYNKGIVSGVSATEFGRDLQISRGDFLLMLYAALGKPPIDKQATFNDVAATDYYYSAIAWGENNGLASGTGGGAYSPKAVLTREQAFTILRQAMPLLGKQCNAGDMKVLEQFSDAAQIADYARGHAATLVEQGIVSGKGTGIDPKGKLTRVEMAALLHKLITYTPIGGEQPPAPEQTPNPDETSEPIVGEFKLNQTELTLPAGAQYTLQAFLVQELQEYAQEGIRWSSSAPSVAAVDEGGVVTNLYMGEGTAEATITAHWNGLEIACVVQCQQAQSKGVVVNAELGLNVRAGAGSQYKIVDRLDNREAVFLLDEDNGWWRVLYQNQDGKPMIAYVSDAYIQILE